jgi:putative DNA primase/helicase
MLDAALHYAMTLRIPVFPCNPDDKRPFTVHGFKDASREEAQVRAWWTRFPDAMIAIPTGEISGVFLRAMNSYVFEINQKVGQHAEGR